MHKRNNSNSSSNNTNNPLRRDYEYKEVELTELPENHGETQSGL